MWVGFYYLNKPVSLTRFRRTVGTFNTWKSIFRLSHKTFSFLNYVNVNSFRSYSLSTFILFVFLFLGLQYNGHKISMIINFFCMVSFSNGFFAKQFFLVLNCLLLSGDIKINSGPKPTSKASLSICYWNLNSISAHNYAKLSLLRGYLAFHKFDIICLSETYLNSSNLPDDETLEILDII